ncbi:MAG: hypothetical protein EB100_06635, partial [Crocinitomicaceae bacterium]|nr:hypothetical protein [Crocinitomicaceae bacterium]
ALQKKQEEKQKKQEAKNVEKQKKIEEKQSLGTCKSILKTGVNKGKPCGCQVIPNSNGLCSRHYKLSLPKSVNNEFSSSKEEQIIPEEKNKKTQKIGYRKKFISKKLQ